MTMKLSGAGVTNVGRVRSHNEDCLLVDNELEIYLVADGVGGRSAGEIASRMAADLVIDSFKNPEQLSGVEGLPEGAHAQISAKLVAAIKRANGVVHEASRNNPALGSMGTTIVVAAREGGTLSIAHVGDSRAYVLKHGQLSQLTDDHSLVSEQLRQGLITGDEARNSNVRNIITRALGVGPEVEVDIDEMALDQGDRILLCTDGLSGMATDEDIMMIMRNEPDPEKCCARLIELANENGGKDNVTAVVIDVPRDTVLGFIKGLFK